MAAPTNVRNPRPPLRRVAHQASSSRANWSLSPQILANHLPAARPAQNGVTSLMVAAQSGHVEVARLLLERGASVDAMRLVSPPPTHANTVAHAHATSSQALVDARLLVVRTWVERARVTAQWD